MIKYYVIKFVSDLRQVGGFLRVLLLPLPILLKMALNTTTLTLSLRNKHLSLRNTHKQQCLFKTCVDNLPLMT